MTDYDLKATLGLNIWMCAANESDFNRSSSGGSEDEM